MFCKSPAIHDWAGLWEREGMALAGWWWVTLCLDWQGALILFWLHSQLLAQANGLTRFMSDLVEMVFMLLHSNGDITKCGFLHLPITLYFMGVWSQQPLFPISPFCFLFVSFLAYHISCILMIYNYGWSWLKTIFFDCMSDSALWTGGIRVQVKMICAIKIVIL